MELVDGLRRVFRGAEEGASERPPLPPTTMSPRDPGDIGIEARDGYFLPFIGGGWCNVRPTGKLRHVFTTVKDYQTRVEVHVLQGKSERAAENTSMFKFALTDLPPAPKGVPQIEVTFEITLEIGYGDVLHVAAKDLASGREQTASAPLFWGAKGVQRMLRGECPACGVNGQEEEDGGYRCPDCGIRFGSEPGEEG